VDDRINAIQNLATDQLIMKEAGFIEIFANNEAQTPVYYDNMQVTMRGGSISEVNAYYPSGYIINDLSTPNAALAIFNAYKYNNAEYETDLSLKWYNLGNRGLDPVAFRFWTPDKYAEKYYHLSLYSICAGNPIRYIDVNGDSIYVSSLITDNEALNESFNQFATSKEGKKFLANYASKGQIIAGHKYTKDGKYHTKGINLNYTAGEINTRGNTDTSEDGTITVTINSSSVIKSQDGNSYNSMNGKARKIFNL